MRLKSRCSTSTDVGNQSARRLMSWIFLGCFVVGGLVTDFDFLAQLEPKQKGQLLAVSENENSTKWKEDFKALLEERDDLKELLNEQEKERKELLRQRDDLQESVKELENTIAEQQQIQLSTAKTNLDSVEKEDDDDSSLERTSISFLQEKKLEVEAQRSEITAKVSEIMSLEELPLPPKTLGAFIHLGKTGGSTACSQLRFACHSFMPKPCKRWIANPSPNESYLSKLTTYIHVPDFNHLQYGNRYYREYDFYVITLRDVYLKFLSSFTYSHPWNKMEAMDSSPVFVPCFPTLESFTEALGDDPHTFEYPWEMNTHNTTNCTNLARALLHKKEGAQVVPHWYYDTQQVWTMANISETTPVLTIRTEHLWEDWVTVNQWLGQPDDVMTYPGVKKRVYAQEQYNVTKDISPTGQRRLCRALKPEYKVYLHAILQRAVNLSPDDKKASMDLALQNCPTEVQELLAEMGIGR